MMKHKVKFRLVGQDGRKQKYSANIDDDTTIPIDGNLLGFESDALFSICIKHGYLTVSDAGFVGGISLNNSSGTQFEVKPGDFLQVGSFSIEFLEAPHRPKENLSNETQFIDLADKAKQRDVTQMRPRPMGIPVTLPAKTAVTAKTSVTTTSTKAGVKTNTVKINTLHHPAAVPKRKLALDLVSWGIAALSAFIIGFNFNHYFAHAEIEYAIAFSIFALVAIVSLILVVNKFAANMQMKGNKAGYIKFISYASLACVPWSFSFALAPGMIFVVSIAQILVIGTAFLIKFSPEIPRFSILAGGWLAAVMIAGTSLTHLLGVSHSENHGESTSTNVATLEPSVAPRPAAIETVAAVVPVATVTAEAPVAAPTSIALVNTQTPQILTASLPKANEPVQDAMANEEYFQAAKLGNLAVIKSLVSRKAVDLNFTLDHGMTALMYAAANGNVNIVKYLVSKKIAINAQDPNGTTALMWAAYKGKINVVKTLVQAGADISIKRDDGDTAYEIARKWKQHDVVYLLQKFSASQRSLASEPVRKRRSR